MLQPSRIEAARAALDPAFSDSPLRESPAISARLGCRLLLKDETGNPIGSFKGRGAGWWLRCHPEVERVLCASAGNFGQGLAWAARRRGVAVEVWAAESAVGIKLEAMRRLGAEVRVEGHDFDAAKEGARRSAAERGLRYVEDGRDDEIAEGAGTIAVELTESIVDLDAVYVPVGNGALVNGVGSWLLHTSPGTRVVGVCAAGAPAMQRSWRRGRAVETASTATIADGIATRRPVAEALDHLRETVDDMLLVEDDAILEAMRLLWREEAIVAEPAGAAALAAAIGDRDAAAGATVAVLVSGANLDPRRRRQWLES